ncbi:unnamed protein product [Rotaria socialis]|uniref:Uncharacterized protein n=3 Tax=Rotaria socialis TaxID=392032 RepID=A0A818RBJ8_9BILA|nr:unnamed protein product [Rotaria socialis]CAF3647105.1 unnamed protein product [Rotaria socialis]CAF3768979.1 unnamed protein product [Rotaria socialis]CAF4558332.1 unnamed protein product [Rotaria socialis]CAF4648893.1 unnamed protein product [Rotaria socialis]
MHQQRMQSFIEDQIRKLIAFRGNCNDNVSQWLCNTGTVFDSVQLQTSNKFLVVQSYLIGTASIWLYFHKSDIHDWDTFKHEILKAFQPVSNRALSVVEQRSIPVQNVNSSSISSKTAPDSSCTSQDNFSAVIDLSGSISNKRSPPSSEIEKSSTPEQIINDDQQLTIAVLTEISLLHQFINENVIEDSTIDNIPNNSPRIITSPQLTC